MEESLDLEFFIKTLTPIEIKYYAKFDITTGEISGIYPSNTGFAESDVWVEIDSEVAERIVEGKECITNFAIDTSTEGMPIVDIRKLKTPDHVHTLFRVPEVQWSTKPPEIVIEYYADSNSFRLTLGEKYSKIKILAFKNVPCHLYITQYNDPNILHETIIFSVDNLINQGFDLIKIKTQFNSKAYSIFTPQLFNVFGVQIV